MGQLRDTFQAIYHAIMDQPQNPQRAFHHHYPLVDMMRTINADGTTALNPEKLLQQGINPKEFVTAWANGFAQETLKYFDNNFTSDVLVKRCNTCLKHEDKYDFGNFLTEDVKQQLEAKRDRNMSYYAHKTGRTLNIA